MDKSDIDQVEDFLLEFQDAYAKKAPLCLLNDSCTVLTMIYDCENGDGHEMGRRITGSPAFAQRITHLGLQMTDLIPAASSLIVELSEA
jgi:hypothetical protein